MQITDSLIIDWQSPDNVHLSVAPQDKTLVYLFKPKNKYYNVEILIFFETLDLHEFNFFKSIGCSISIKLISLESHLIHVPD